MLHYGKANSPEHWLSLLVVIIKQKGITTTTCSELLQHEAGTLLACVVFVWLVVYAFVSF